MSGTRADGSLSVGDESPLDQNGLTQLRLRSLWSKSEWESLTLLKCLNSS